MGLVIASFASLLKQGFVIIAAGFSPLAWGRQ